MTGKPKPNHGTYVWYGGSIVIFLVGAIAFAADGHVLWTLVAVLGAAFCAGFLFMRRRS